jgi:hypothetical protein
VLRRIYGPTREELTTGWRKLHEEFHDLCSSPYIIMAMQSRRMRWAGYVMHGSDEKFI